MALTPIDGWNRLHNLEFAAYDAVINDSRRPNTKAADLATRFSRALAPLFVASAGESQEAHFKSWGQISIVYENRHFHISEIFEIALRLKASTVVTDERFEFVLLPPGTQYKDNHSNNNERYSQKSCPSHLNFRSPYFSIALLLGFGATSESLRCSRTLSCNHHASLPMECESNSSWADNCTDSVQT